MFFAKHIDVMDAAEEAFAARDLKTISIRGDQSALARQKEIDAFNNDPEVAVAVCSLTAAGVGLNLQAASNVVLAELSWTAAEQTQAIDRVHRIGQEEPVTAWRIIAAQTIDSKIAELIDAKQGLAARALDGSDVELGSADSVQLDALIHLLDGRAGLTLRRRRAAERASGDLGVVGVEGDGALVVGDELVVLVVDDGHVVGSCTTRLRLVVGLLRLDEVVEVSSSRYSRPLGSLMPRGYLRATQP